MMMNRDSHVDSITLEELSWLSSCIQVHSHDSPILTPTKNHLLGPRSTASGKRKAMSEPRIVPSKFPRSMEGLFDTNESDAERQDTITPLRVLRQPESSKKTVHKSQLSLTKPHNHIPGASSSTLFPSSSRSDVSSGTNRTKSSHVPLPRSTGNQAERVQTSTSLPTQGSPTVEPEPLPCPPPKNDRSRKTRSMPHPVGQPLWTSVLRPKSKSPKSIPSLKALPSQSISTSNTPPISFSKASPENRKPRASSEEPTLPPTIAYLSKSPTAPLEIPRFPCAGEDVFGKSSPTWLPEDDVPKVPPSSSAPASSRRKSSVASSATTSSSGIDGTSTPGSSKSVKFVERPTVHYPSTLYWDKSLEEVVPPFDPDTIDLDEIPELDSPEATPIQSDPIVVEESSSSSFGRSLITLAHGSSGWVTFFSGKKKKPTHGKQISGPFTLNVGASSLRNGASPSPPPHVLPSSRPPTPSSIHSRPSTPQSRSSTPTTSRTRSPSQLPRRQLSVSNWKRGAQRSRPHMYPLSRRGTPHASVIASTDSFKSVSSVGIKSIRSVPEGHKSSQRRMRFHWWSK